MFHFGFWKRDRMIRSGFKSTMRHFHQKELYSFTLYVNIQDIHPGLVDLPTDLSSTEELYCALCLHVVNYSRRKLTFDTDRLTALTGLVKKARPCQREHFIAGVWKEYLGRDLLWSASIYSHCLTPGAGL